MNIRKVVLLGLAIISFSAYAQDEDVDTRKDVVGELTIYNSGLWVKPVRTPKVKGDIYLFNNWKNLATIISGKGKQGNTIKMALFFFDYDDTLICSSFITKNVTLVLLHTNHILILHCRICICIQKTLLIRMWLLRLSLWRLLLLRR